jgi:CheY-like chemotaxis protein
VQSRARAHEQVTRDSWGPAKLRDLIETEAVAFLSAKRNKLKAEGPNVLIHPAAFTGLALVFHELMTNAVKYGALSDGGSVSVKWHLDEDGSLLIDWAERGGPPVTPPSRRGFGTVVIEQTIPHDLGGDAKLSYQLSGLSAHFCIPSRHVAGIGEDEPGSAVEPAPVSGDKPLEGRKVMLVEDSLIIALDGEDVLRSLGAEDVKLASTVRGALQLIADYPIDLAVLDYNLGAENSESIAEALKNREIPFLFATGYGSGLDAARYSKVPIVTKPYGRGEIATAVRELDAMG